MAFKIPTQTCHAIFTDVIELSLTKYDLDLLNGILYPGHCLKCELIDPSRRRADHTELQPDCNECIPITLISC